MKKMKKTLMKKSFMKKSFMKTNDNITHNAKVLLSPARQHLDGVPHMRISSLQPGAFDQNRLNLDILP